MDDCPRERWFGYTLPELLLSVLVLGVLLSLLVGWTRAVRRDLNMEAGRRLLVTLNRALDAYHAATGAWPPEERLPAAQRAVGALLEQPESAKVMAEISASAWSSADRRRLLDAWRTPLRYLGPQHSPDRVAINDGRPIFVSAGPDREFGERGSVAVGDNIASDDAGVYDATEGNRVQPQ